MRTCWRASVAKGSWRRWRSTGMRGVTTHLERHGPVSAGRAALDPDRRQGRLDAGRAVSEADTDAAQNAGYPVTIKIYPGDYHSFDSYNPVRYVAARVNANAPGGRGATTGGD